MIARQQYAEERGRQLLLEAGFAIGDTVYLDGTHEGVITGAQVPTYPMLAESPFKDDLQVSVACTRAVALQIAPSEKERSFSKMVFSCPLCLLRKDRLEIEPHDSGK